MPAAAALTPAEVLQNLLDRIAEKYGNRIPEEDEQVDQAELRALIDQTLAELDGGESNGQR